MRLLKKKEKNLVIKISIDELDILKNCMLETFNSLDDFDFEIRMGYSEKDVRELFSQVLDSWELSKTENIEFATIIDTNWILCPNCINEIKKCTRQILSKWIMMLI